MSIWSQKRKQTIILVFLLLLLIPTGIIAWKIFYKVPTCFDGKRNQGERGIDCSGPCSLVCRNETASPVILWQRLFKVSGGIYTAAAYIQNPNLGAGARNVPYRVRVYNQEGISMYERRGFIDIHPKYSFPIIEPGLDVGERVPSRMTFEFLEEPRWIQESDELLPLTISEEVSYNVTTHPRIEAKLQNQTVKDILNVPVAVVVYNRDNNAMAVSRTVVERVPASADTKVVFTWPEPFLEPVLRTEIILLR
jgi:hypothetical protein